MNPTSRRAVSVLVRIGLVGLAIVLVGSWLSHRIHAPRYATHARIETVEPPDAALGPGDYRLYNVDSAVDVTLVGNRILAGLSPKTVAEVRGKIESSAQEDTGGMGGAIASMVKKTVADRIGTHAAFNLADIRDIRYVAGRLVFDWRGDANGNVFGKHVRVNGKDSNRFRQDEAERFIAAFHARKAQLGQ